MSSAIGETLPLALGVAIAPLPMAAAILTLLPPRRRFATTGFLLGWLAGVSLALVVFSIAGSAIPVGEPGEPRPIRGALRLVVGCLLALTAAKEWRMRPPVGVEPAAPRWMDEVRDRGPAGIAGIVFLLALINPKNLLLAAGAGIAISESLPGNESFVLFVFVLIAALPVYLPIIVLHTDEQLGAERVRRLRWRLLHHGSAIATTVPALLAVVMIGRGIAAF